jgi:ankyrin repeat protein
MLEHQYRDSREVQATTDMLDVLFKKGADPNVICSHGDFDFSPLSRAVGLARPDIVAYLLSRSADPNLYFAEKDYRPMSPLMHAVWIHGYHYKGMTTVLEKDTRKECYDIARMLIASGADINYRGSWKEGLLGAGDPENKTALMIAAEFLDRDMIDFLLAHRPRKDLKDFSGDTADVYAARAGDTELAQQLKP